MSNAGLQVWSEFGVKILDTNNRVSRVFGVLRISGSDGSIALPPHISSLTFAAFQRDTSVTTWNGMGAVRVPVFTTSGTSISWYYPQIYGMSGNVINSEVVGGWLTYGAY